MISF
jgi:formylmethanofuran dehydrogenase subunit B